MQVTTEFPDYINVSRSTHPRHFELVAHIGAMEFPAHVDYFTRGDFMRAF